MTADIYTAKNQIMSIRIQVVIVVLVYIIVYHQYKILLVSGTPDSLSVLSSRRWTTQFDQLTHEPKKQTI